jgi:hypothetical protein
MDAPSRLDFVFADHQEAVELKADLRGGWRLLGDTYGYDSEETLGFRGGCSIRGRLKVYAGRRCAERAKDFPDVKAEGGYVFVTTQC